MIVLARRPYDPRMWCAMAGCYESLSKDDEAMKCYERAACHDDRLTSFKFHTDIPSYVSDCQSLSKGRHAVMQRGDRDAEAG